MKRRPQEPMPDTGGAIARYLIGLLLAAVGSSLLALFQWSQLFVSKLGESSFCTFSENVSCDAVWASPFAKKIQQATGVPVAGWGLIWSLIALTMAVLAIRKALRREAIDVTVRGARWTGIGGAVTVIGLFGVSLKLGVLCPTCLLTYALVGAYLLSAFLLPSPEGGLFRGVAASLVPVFVSGTVAFVLCLVPGSKTPLAEATGLETAKVPPPRDDPAPQSALGEFLGSLPTPTRQLIANGLAGMRASAMPDVSRFRTRRRVGPETAPVRIVEFSDILCGHCRRLNEAMMEIEHRLPQELFSVESRFFPLDAACNPALEHSDGKGVRCEAARVLICLENDERYRAVRERLFAEQMELTRERVFAVPSELGIDRKWLEGCVTAPDTEAKLREDIDYARNYDVHGTPIVLMNGRLAMGLPPLIYAVVLAGGALDAPDFAVLPPARPPEAHAH